MIGAASAQGLGRQPKVEVGERGEASRRGGRHCRPSGRRPKVVVGVNRKRLVGFFCRRWRQGKGRDNARPKIASIARSSLCRRHSSLRPWVALHCKQRLLFMCELRSHITSNSKLQTPQRLCCRAGFVCGVQKLYIGIGEAFCHLFVFWYNKGLK